MDNQFAPKRSSTRNYGNLRREPSYERRPVNARRSFYDIQPTRSQFTPPKTYAPIPLISGKLKPNLQNSSFGLAVKKHKKTNKNLALISMAVIVFMTGMSIAVLQIRTNNQVAAQVSQLKHNVSAESPPDETPPDANSLTNYRVPPLQPRIITIDKIGVSARVLKLGVNNKNQIEAPGNVFDAGWYEDSASPGDNAGAILIDGHVQGPTKPGIFANLKTLKNGDQIQIERGDGKKFSFKVVGSKTYSANNVDMVSALKSTTPGKLGLNLITCTGPISKNNYQDRLIVFTVQN